MEAMTEKHFSLSCTDCDAGDEFESEADAVTAGWKEICEDDGPSWNYLGACPHCQRQEVMSCAASLLRGTRQAVHPSEKPYQDAWPTQVRKARSPKRVFADVLAIANDLHEADENIRKLEVWRGQRSLLE